MKVSECMRSNVPYLTVPGTREDVLQLMTETQAERLPSLQERHKDNRRNDYQK